ncbi:MAG: TolC family protein [Syntrophomonadales bacterium]|jgi:outer membrane protein TolC
MDRILRILFIAALLLVSVVVNVDQALGEEKYVLTIQSALDRAYAYSPLMKTSEFEVEKSERIRSDAVDFVRGIPMTGFISGTTLVGDAYTGYLQADMGWQIAKDALEKKKNSITVDVYAKYYTVLRAESQIDVAKKDLERDTCIFKIAELQRRLGMRTELDLRNVQAQKEQSMVALADAEKQAEMARNDLYILLGLPNGDTYVLDQPTWTTIDLAPLDTEVSRALAFSHDVYSADMAANIANQIKYWAKNWTIGQIDADISLQNKELIKNSVKAAVNSLYWNLKDLPERRAALELAIQNAHQALDLTRLKYENGLATRTEVIQAEAVLKNLENQFVALKCQNEICVAQFKALTGR